jgi:hypothetical protein
MAAPANAPAGSADDRTRLVVEQFYDNSLRADIGGVPKIPHPDVVNPEPSTLPYGGTHTGPRRGPATAG